MITTNLYRTIIITMIIVLLIYFAQPLMMPIIFSGLCAMFVHPLVKKLESWGLNLVLSSLFVVIFVGAFLLGVFALLTYEGINIISNLSMSNAQELTEDPISKIESKTHTNLAFYSDEFSSIIASGKEKLLELIPQTLMSVNRSILFLLTCPVYIFFMLICRTPIRKFYYTSFKQQNRKIANRILNQIELVYISYLRGLFFVILIVSSLTSLGLYLLGIEYALFIGILSGVLTLVPYLGVFVSALVPIVITFLTKDSLWYVFGVIAIYGLVQFLEGNIITPKIMGKQVGVNPLVIILGIVIFGTIGGIVGMLLTVPVLALIKTIAFYIPTWKPLRSLLQNH